MDKYPQLTDLPTNFTAERVKMICCDIDGTTLDPSHQVTPYTLETFRLVLALRPDLAIIFATGRSRVSASYLKASLAELGHSLGIYLNGSLCGLEDGDSTHEMKGFRPVREAPIPPIEAGWYLRWAVYNNRPVVLYNYDKILTSHECETFLITQAGYVHEPYPEKRRAEELMADVESGSIVVHKLSFMSPSSELDQTFLDLNSAPTRPTNTILVRTELLRLEVMHYSATKATAIRALAESVAKCTMDEVIAFGDGANDVEMISEVGMGVAMGNGVAVVKTGAKYVAPSNGMDGLARTLRAIFGIAP
ncbi:hypothetical protein HK097_002467 [Rhizophlyctis rosea]|uniref:Haloacid dehalogenase-like hydrolase n=1 Tax=Rhizophlyctis rosea TaxID=64517 RepID=A0AAD5WYE7_9FUNG|nr:hypothetical protein HK097_002467 [Rhizophlyctis rosea]